MMTIRMISELLGGELKVLVERSLGGRNPTTQVQGSRVTWRADGRRTTLCPRGLEGSLGSKRPTTAGRSRDNLSR